MAALDRDHPDRTHHVGVDDAHDAKGRLAQGQSQLCRQRRNCFVSLAWIEAHATADELFGQTPEREIGIRDGRFSAALAIAGGAGVGAGAHWSDAH